MQNHRSALARAEALHIWCFQWTSAYVMSCARALLDDGSQLSWINSLIRPLNGLLNLRLGNRSRSRIAVCCSIPYFARPLNQRMFKAHKMLTAKQSTLHTTERPDALTLRRGSHSPDRSLDSRAAVESALPSASIPAHPHPSFDHPSIHNPPSPSPSTLPCSSHPSYVPTFPLLKICYHSLNIQHTPSTNMHLQPCRVQVCPALR